MFLQHLVEGCVHRKKRTSKKANLENTTLEYHHQKRYSVPCVPTECISLYTYHSIEGTRYKHYNKNIVNIFCWVNPIEVKHIVYKGVVTLAMEEHEHFV